MEMAILDSVTVSIPAAISGILSLIFLVKYVAILVFLGSTSDSPGKSRTSSNVKPSPTNSK